jgi:hypothetical protein
MAAAAAPAAEKQTTPKDTGRWQPLTPLTGPLGGFFAYTVPRLGAIVLAPNGEMVWVPDAKAQQDDRDTEGFKLIFRGNG